ncbi:uroporphyrinogen-III C-methyltransferase [bacterium]|nr:uroporphyrinogen-III C-methyltransferase [bacterium]
MMSGMRATEQTGARAPLARPVVSLVGAGPGDPELLTLRAVERIRSADVILVDRLVDARILSFARSDADIQQVGKSRGEHSVPQSEINRRLIALARAGLRVVRLKGGDPFIFGRGGEEAAALRAAGVDVEIVPGVSAALACAASAGVPLTHRGDAQSVTFVTAHAALGTEPDLDWPALARANQTVVVFMGVGVAPLIEARLLAAGRAGDTPVVIVENGTRLNERILRTPLGALGACVSGEGVAGPAILIIGECAAHGDVLALANARQEIDA